jgi:UDP:flavonoid glycosyltransferase YjiC (YdhE family)
LPPVHRILNQWIHSPDRVIGLFPPWFAPPPDDWPAQTVLTGFPLYDEADVTPLDPELQDFLKAGEPPLAFTPGSAMRHGDEFFAVAVDVCRKLGRRGLLLSRHDRHMPADLPAGVRHVAYVPFSRLLPHCAALIHHGGIGTSAQALAAGIPQLVVPMSHDQPDNAMKLHELGVAEIVPAGRFSTARATVAISRLMDSNHRAACLEIKKRFVGADPISETATLIEGVIRD